ncbi:MAG: 3-dehydroquinate synthase [Phycisphaerales bacterium]|nr:3-dehydroquinate synthase [Phycisphaerales bacterium]
MIDLQVSVPGGDYPVRIEAGLLTQAGGLVEEVHDGHRGLVVMDENVREAHGDTLLSSFGSSWQLARHDLVATEHNKRIETVASIYESSLRAGLDRGSLVIGCGGGITGDVAGFAAASFLRGIDLVLVPTTLLAMVDASVGGKTGVNLLLPDGRGVGKNLAGAFWQPRAVLVDPLVLSTLPTRDVRCGLAECIKHGIISDPGLLEMIAADRESILAVDPDTITALVERAVKVKVSVVQQDEREAGGRASLNLGHTFAHAIEPLDMLDLRHGEAVAIGLVAAATCSHRLGRVDGSMVEQTRNLLEAVGLPTRLSHPVPIADLVAAMRFDKKTRDGQIRLVLPGPRGVEIVDDVPEADVHAAWLAVGAAD